MADLLGKEFKNNYFVMLKITNERYGKSQKSIDEQTGSIDKNTENKKRKQKVVL